METPCYFFLGGLDNSRRENDFTKELGYNPIEASQGKSHREWNIAF